LTTLDGPAPPQGRARGAWARFRWPLMIGGPVVILAIVAFFVLTGGKSESTDDAYVRIAEAPISAAIAGRVTEVDVVDNQRVKAGQVLFRLDPQDELAAAQRAQAALASARLQVVGLRANYDEQKLLLGSALTTEAYAKKEANRQASLVTAGVASVQQAAEARHTADRATAQVAVDRQQVAAALANLGGAADAPESFPAVEQARAAQEASRITLSYTTVVSPSDGIVARVDQLQKGAYVNAAQTLFYVLSGEPWVEANFKEDQLRKMRVGQPATIVIDALGGKGMAGHVQSFSPGSGSAFSALPAQNATGNWVKVVQRLPVHIAFDKAPPEVAGRAGLSAKVTVDIRGGSK
jgi:membrane fusion protein (multidrug efflux system)